MSEVGLIFYEYREEIGRRWVVALRDLVSEDYFEILDSPLGQRFYRKVIDDFLDYSDAEDFKVQPTLRRICDEMATEAGRRSQLGFELVDVVAATQALRLSFWDALLDASVSGKLPPVGVMIQEMKFVDDFFDRLMRSQVTGFLATAEVSEAT